MMITTRFRKIFLISFAALAIITLYGCKSQQVEFHSGETLVFAKPWKTVKVINQPTKRHEASFVAYKGKMYLLGGRRINPVDSYDPITNTWQEGVEWYFGGKHPNNDLNSEDWRIRHKLWTQTKYAMDFFQQYLPFWQMKAANQVSSNKQAYVFAKSNHVYAVYIPKGQTTNLSVSSGIMTEGTRYKLAWFDPKSGGDLQQERLIKVSDTGRIELDRMPSTDRDWVAALKHLYKPDHQV